LLHGHAELLARLEAVEKDVATLQAFSENARHQRAAVLNEASRPRIWCPRDERNVRNAGTHGGNVVADIHIIQSMEKEDPGTADRLKAAFFRMYQLEFRDFHLLLLSAPTEVVKVCNILANILLVKPWKLKPQGIKDQIRTRCVSILQAWSDSLRDIDNDFLLSPDLRREYQFVRNWYLKVEKECA
jgi:hypothetical protein